MEKGICTLRKYMLTEVGSTYVMQLTIGLVLQMSVHNSGISVIPVVGVATNSPPCLVVAHFYASLRCCLSSSKTYISLSTTRGY